MFKSQHSLPSITDIIYLCIADKSKMALNILIDLLKTYLILARNEQINSNDKCEHFCLLINYFSVSFSICIDTLLYLLC